MRYFLKLVWFAFLAVWVLTGLLLAAGIVSASQSFPFATLAVQAVLWCLPPAALWAAGVGILRLVRFCRARGPEAARGAGKAALFAFKTLDKVA